MAELRKCGRCKSVILLTYFGINRRGEHTKSCITCLDKKQKQDTIELYVIIVDVNLINISDHYITKRRYACQVHRMETKPDFEEWLMHHDYHALLWECKELLVEMMLRGERDGPCKNCRKNSEEDNYEDKLT